MSDGPNEYEDFLFYPLALALKDHGYPDPPLLGICPHTGYAMCRTGYGKNDRFFAIKTGESWNHNHLDAGSLFYLIKIWKLQSIVALAIMEELSIEATTQHHRLTILSC